MSLIILSNSLSLMTLPFPYDLKRFLMSLIMLSSPIFFSMLFVIGFDIVTIMRIFFYY